jgi:hypothetical protein
MAAVSGHAMAFDEARGRTVLFGGNSGPFQSADTGEWDGAAWTLRDTNVVPARFAHALAYDRTRRRVVLFGGRTGLSTDLGDTWEWNGDRWVQRSSGGPSPRAGHSLAYDPLRQRTVLFGAAAPADTWIWDGVAWTQLAPVHSPGDRLGAAFAFDETSGRALLFGGASMTQPTLLGDTWSWDGTDWTLLAATSAVSARGCAAIAFDAGLGRVVLYGGGTNTPLNGGAVFFGDAFEWDGANWLPHAAPPSARTYGTMVYDRTRSSLVLHGGGVLLGTLDDTWEQSSGASSWNQVRPTGPYTRYGHALASDTARGRVVMFGGRLPTLWQPRLSETWEWDGYRWHAAQPATSPAPRDNHAMAFDAARQRTILFGGFDPSTGLGAADTWSWDGANWTQLAPAASPPPRAAHAMAYDSTRQQVLLFSGTAGNDTWTWNGANWTQQFPVHSPTIRQDAGMAEDFVRQVVVLFGGYLIAARAATNETWEWNGVDWVQRLTPVSPAARVMHAMAFDATRLRVEMTSGLTSLFNSQQLSDTWEYDGVNWNLVLANGPRPSFEHALAYDSVRRQLLLFGGAGSTNDVWFFGDTTQAQSTPVGSGCAGSAGVPVLAGSPPSLGESGVALELIDAAPAAPAAIGLSFASASVPLGGGCTLLLGPSAGARFLLTNATGNARQPLPVPEAPALRGLTVFAQGAVLDAAGAFAGLAFTAGLQLVVGD